MRQQNIVFVSVATGGLDPAKHSLLSVALSVCDSRYVALSEHEFFIKQDEYVLTGRALELNGLDMRNTSNWLDASSAKKAMLDALSVDTRVLDGATPRNLWVLHGKNPTFASSFLRVFFGDSVYKRIFLHWTRDIAETYLSLVDDGIVPALDNLRLPDLCAALKVIPTSTAPSALYDVRMTVACARRMYELRQRVFQAARVGFATVAQRSKAPPAVAGRLPAPAAKPRVGR